MTIKLFHFIKWHRKIAWLGGIALMLFAISGILHPLMSWTGPQASQHRPPTAPFSAPDFVKTQKILQQNGFDEVYAVKIVPGPETHLLQVTESINQPRRYFDLTSSQELKNYEQKYAIWLARYYTGLDAEVSSVDFQTEFDNAYPWVNRLLPVYRINFADSDKTTAFIFTELGTLAGLTNSYKTTLQSVFRWLHTMSFLGDVPWIRFALMLCLVFSVLTLVVTGTVMIFKFKRRQKSVRQTVHRSIAFLVWIALGFFSVSGSYHLIHGELSTPMQALIPAPAFKIGSDLKGINTDAASQLTSVSLIQADQLLYRLQTAAVSNNTDRNSRFQGQASEGTPLYFDALTGAPVELAEESLATHYAGVHEPGVKVLNLEKIEQFGGDYDFRNKRLPVWRVSLESGEIIFIDNASGLMVDKVKPADAWERLSFSFLHKYNFLTPVLGRFYRDLVMVIILIFAIIMTGVGYLMLFQHRGKSR